MLKNLVRSLFKKTITDASNSQKVTDIFSLEQDEYNICSIGNLESSLEKELKALLIVYKTTLKKVLSGNLDFYSLSKEELCIINTCKATFYQYYDGYELKSATRKGIIVHPPEKYLVYTDDGLIDPWKSERLPVKIDWCCVEGFITFECTFPFNTLKELALLNPFFVDMDNSELDKHLMALLPKIVY